MRRQNGRGPLGITANQCVPGEGAPDSMDMHHVGLMMQAAE